MQDTDGLDRCGVGIRGVAMAIDSVVWLAGSFVAAFAVAAATGQIEATAGSVTSDLEGGAALASMTLWLAIGIGYHTLLEWQFGRTIGKALVSVRVVADDGAPLSLGASLIRNVARLVDWLPFVYLVGIAAIVVSDEQRRIGDRLGGTAVVRP
ncbi:RDD family protein [Halosimplex sp. TS25]|uniref:RDD family protein n=1 Tax=Halosimplex rarum TaxID=3396619 RepID=UPI0039EB2786